MTEPRDDLDDFFTAARANRPEPSQDFMARMQAQALAEMPVAPARVAPSPGLWAQVLAGLGGWGALSGLAAATVAGVWIGAAPPEAISTSVSSLIYGSENLYLDPLSGFDFETTEG